MATYMYIFRGGEDPGALGPAQLQEHLAKWGGWIQALAKEGRFKAGEPLHPGGKVVRGRDKVVTDGPFAEAKDLVGGYLVVTADTLAGATEMARGCPIFETDGTVEVREIREMK